MIATRDSRALLLAGAMVLALAGGATAQAGCGGDHSVSLEPQDPIESAAQLEPAEAVEDEATAEAQPEPAPAAAKPDQRVVHLEETPEPKPAPVVPIILGTYR